MKNAARFTSALYLLVAVVVLIMGFGSLQAGDPVRALTLIALGVVCALMALRRARQVR
jgi:hypothetical protein